MEERRRRIDLDGTVNLRDLGGYPAGPGRRTRWGRVYRSDSLAELTPEDHEKLAGLGLRTVVDLRLPQERRSMPSRLPERLGIRTVEIGFVPAGTLEMLRLVALGDIDPAGLERHVVGHYRRFPVDHVPEYRRMVRAIAEPGALPALVHCTSGKDRTGFAAVVILLIAGVPREVILEDYLLTNRYQRDISHLHGRATSKAVADLLATAQAVYLEAAFAEIDRVYGSSEGYLAQGLGIDEAERAALVELVTEAV
jgi:protein-tyrosine phosphatase